MNANEAYGISDALCYILKTKRDLESTKAALFLRAPKSEEHEWYEETIAKLQKFYDELKCSPLGHTAHMKMVDAQRKTQERNARWHAKYDN